MSAPFWNGVKWSAGLAVVALSLIAQTGGIPECGLGMDKDHPCRCTEHTNQVQVEEFQTCVSDRLKNSNDGPTQINLACSKAVTDHCTLIERYGNWQSGFDENGMHKDRMPNQCTRACTKSHCKCRDGAVCHVLHDPKEDKTK